MPGAVVENLSGRKLAVLVGLLFAAQIGCFLIGGIKTPAPSGTIQSLANKCLDLKHEADTGKWFIPWPTDGFKEQVCFRVETFDENIIHDRNVTANQIVFAFKLPHRKDNTTLDFSRWQQNLIGVLQVDIAYDGENGGASTITPEITMELRLAYRNKNEDSWNLLAESLETRRLECTIPPERQIHGYSYECNMVPLFELGNIHHDFYLLNIRLPSNESLGWNRGLGKLTDLTVTAIHQNGGFVKKWLGMKSVFFPVVVAALAWFWSRVVNLNRSPSLLETMLLSLGIALSLLNLPLEFFSLAYDTPWMPLVSDMRQGFFYAMLLSFWLVFAGEHLMDDIERNSMSAYKKNLASVGTGCLSLFIFDMCERGTQLHNPFQSIWQTSVGANCALAFIIFAAISACIYFLFLAYLIFKVFINISSKRSALPAMSSLRRMHYEGIIYRFKFLMLFTLLCAAMTVVSFIIGQVSEGEWKWEEDSEIHIQYTSAFFTGVYGMWNIYVLSLLALYAPSHKRWPQESDTMSGSGNEQVEFSRLPTEPSEAANLATFMQKQSVD